MPPAKSGVNQPGWLPGDGNPAVRDEARGVRSAASQVHLDTALERAPAPERPTR